jgi:hypothetical protein
VHGTSAVRHRDGYDGAVRAWAVIVIVLVAAGVVLAVVLNDRHDGNSGEGLEPVVESPRPPIEADTPMPILRGFAPPTSAPVGGVARSVLLAERNARAREHREAVVLYEAGREPIRDVEEAETRLLDARHRLGEIDGPTWHRARAALIARDAERARLLVEAGRLLSSEASEISLSLEMERMLAGDANDYGPSREAFFATLTDRHLRLAEAGLASATALQNEFKQMEARFPLPDAAKAQDH